MLIFSFKMTKTKAIAAICICVAFVVMAFSAFYGDANISTSGSLNLSAGTAQERIEYIEKLGWQAETEPCEVIDVIIPTEFDSVYEKYNVIQLSEGFDLTNYKGKKVKRYTYNINNYILDEKPAENIRLNLLVYEGKVIGGDVCSTELAGFMQGLSKKSE